MSITVVISRDDTGAPTTRDVYTAGARYAIDNSGLQVFSAQSQLLALYGSGNWSSVNIDDSVRVVPVGRHDPVDGDPLAAEITGPEVDLVADLDLDLEVVTEVDVELQDLETGDVEPDPGAAPDREAAPHPIPAPSTASAPAAAPAPVPRSAPASPRREAGALPPPPADVFIRDQSRPAETAGTLPPGMRRVEFRPRPLRAPVKAEPPAAPRSQLRPVVFRTRLYRAARPARETEAAEPDRAGDDPAGPSEPG